MNTEQFNIPSQYQHPSVIVLRSVNTQSAIDKACGKAPEGYTKVGCEKGKEIWLLNPCFAPEEKDHNSYAHSLCHEIGHYEGWHHINE